ncbi:putative ribonuclease h protein [Fagus crenata]
MIHSLPKIQIFLWKCLLNSLPVSSILAGRGLHISPSCGFCNADQESILHVLRDCYLAKSFWHEYNFSIFDPDFFSSNLDTWLQSNACCSGMVPNKGYQWGTLFLFGIWSLWLQRNKFIF